MAIIRIKRTTSSTLPTGLTFGELAYVQGSGGYTANRLYIANNAGVCVWIGAEILNSPTYWSGATAETTIPTVNAVQNFVSGFVGATVFSSDITLNLSGTKSFGKYTNGQVLPSAGKTPIEVISDALIESVIAGVTLRGLAGFGDPVITYGSIPFGATAVRNGLTWGYRINTPGATAVGATLEFRRGGAGSFTTISTSLYDTTAPYWVQADGLTTNAYLHSFEQPQYTTSTINYRYTILDNSGAGSTYAEFNITPTAYATPTNTTTLTSHITPSGETSVFRERGNTGSTLSITLSSTNDTRWIKITDYLVQYRLNGAGNWYNALNNTLNDTTFTSVTPAGTIGPLSIAVKPNVAGITQINFQVQVKDTYNTSGVLTNGTIGTVSLRKRIFYGATNGNFLSSVTPETARTLPFSVLGPTSGTAISGASPFTFTFNTSSDASFLRYVIALPKGLTLNTNADVSTGGVGAVLSTGEVLAGKANPPDDPCQLNLGLTQANDFSGVAHDYNIFTWTVGDQYSSGTTVTVRCNGTVT